jgi:hypothetical protein
MIDEHERQNWEEPLERLDTWLNLIAVNIYAAFCLS